MKRTKKTSGSALIGKVVILTKQAEKTAQAMMAYDDYNPNRDSHACKLVSAEGEVLDTWHDEGQWLQVRILGGDFAGELITLVASKVSVIRDTVDPEKATRAAKRAELLEVASRIFNCPEIDGTIDAVHVAQMLIANVDKAMSVEKE